MKKNKIRLAIIFGVEFVAIVVLLLLIFFAGKKSYTVTFNLNGGTLLSGDTVQTVRQGGSATPPVVVKDGCYFHSWSTSYSQVTKDITVYAIWEYETTVGITYSTDGDGYNSNYCEITGSFSGLRGDVFIGAYHDKRKVLGISDRAFENRIGIEHVYMLDGILTIGERAFAGCTSLESIVLPNTLAEIDASAFEGCTSLKTVVLPAALESIAERAFAGCTSLEEIIFLSEERIVEVEAPETDAEQTDDDKKKAKDDETSEPETYEYYALESIGKEAFAGCELLTSVSIPSVVKEIGEGAFSGCIALEAVDLPDAIVQIAARTFEGCVMLKTVDIPEGVIAIGDGAFADCTALASITLPSSLESIGERAFSGCDAMSSISIPKSVKVIGSLAFDNSALIINVYVTKAARPLGWASDCFASEPIWLMVIKPPEKFDGIPGATPGSGSGTPSQSLEAL